MYPEITEILDSADRALASAVSVVPPGALDRAAHLVLRLRHRVDYPEDLALVALAGGTGSGKSSLFNELLGTDAADVGGIRPTTSSPLISVPRRRLNEISGYLQWFEPADRVAHEGLDGIVLIDLPDTDSLERDHRLVVEELLPRVDAVVWVTDVEKYRDDSLHRGFLRIYSEHGGRFLFALNQVDRIPSAEVAMVADDFRDALVEDGYRDPSVFPIAAGPPIGPPSGVDELRDALVEVATTSIPAKLISDLGDAVGEIAREVGRSGVDFENRWAEARGEAAALAVSGEPVDAGRRAATFFSELAGEISGEPSEVALGISAHVGERLRDFARGAAEEIPYEELPGRGWRKGRSKARDENRERRVAEVTARLDGYAGDLIRPLLRRRAEAIAALTGLVAAIDGWREKSAS